MHLGLGERRDGVWLRPDNLDPSRLPTARAVLEGLVEPGCEGHSQATMGRQPDHPRPVLFGDVGGAVDGAVIELGSGGLVYRYHSGGERTPFPCDRPLDPVPVPIS